jgi:DNA-binding transcriptional LysR family regulator
MQEQHSIAVMGSSRKNPLKLFQLQVLIAVADCSSFSEAAQEMQLSQSAVSYAIATLEEELGVILFSRGRYGAKLTPVGEQIVARARKATELLDDIVKQANLAKGLQGGHVRISSFRSAATHILPDVIAEFCRRYPAIAVSIADYEDSPDVEEDLRKGRADLGVTYLPIDSEFEIWDLMQDEVVALFGSNFQSKKDRIDWDDLKAYPLIMAPDGDVCDAMIYNHCLRYGIELQPTYRIRSDSTVVNMVAKELGFALCPFLAAEPIPAGIQVYSLPVPLYRTICVAALTDALLTPAAYTFLDLLRSMSQEKASQYVNDFS